MFCVGVCMRTELCGVRRPPVRPCAPLGTMCTGYLRRAVPVSSVWLRAHLVWLRGQGVAACGRMCGGRRVEKGSAVWRYRAVLWNFVSRMWKSCCRREAAACLRFFGPRAGKIVRRKGQIEKCEYKKSVKSRILLFRQLRRWRIS